MARPKLYTKIFYFFILYKKKTKYYLTDKKYKFAIKYKAKPLLYFFQC